MTDITALLRRAAHHNVTIFFDHSRGYPVIWGNPPARLLEALHLHHREVSAVLSRSGFWGCCCPQCRGTVH